MTVKIEGGVPEPLTRRSPTSPKPTPTRTNATTPRSRPRSKTAGQKPPPRFRKLMIPARFVPSGCSTRPQQHLDLAYRPWAAGRGDGEDGIYFRPDDLVNRSSSWPARLRPPSRLAGARHRGGTPSRRGWAGV